jgi:vacuolar-type H+-ATPase subunit E/Vma4
VGSDALRAAIAAEGRARVAAILRAAETEASQLDREAASRARQRRDDELRDLAAAARSEANARIAVARAEARKLVLEARDELIQRVFGRARDTIASEAEALVARGELLARVEQALEHLPAEHPIVLTCASAVAPVLEAAFANREEVRVECDPDIGAGFRATGAHGAVVIDATLSSLLDRERPTLAIEMLQKFHAEQTGSRGGA